jgi:NAD(P)-dependent dehydrogenase (short-subunit alcohol dehydrogenase family)
MRNLDKSYSKIKEDIAKEAVGDDDNLSLEVLQLDVVDDKSVKDAINMIAEKQKRIDVVVNNADYGSTGAVEDFSIDQIKTQFETNFLELLGSYNQYCQ